jgi:uncharacterized OsmC-like protein
MPSVRDLQAPLRARYKSEPSSAKVVDRAASAAHDLGDPFHARVSAQGADIIVPVATHRGHGGPHDAATPGDLLCAALCTCYELTTRMVANAMGLQIDTLEVRVEGHVDLRGSMGMGGAPVGFQAMRIFTNATLRNGGPAEVKRLLSIAESYCVVGQTLRGGVGVEFLTAE